MSGRHSERFETLSQACFSLSLTAAPSAGVDEMPRNFDMRMRVDDLPGSATFASRKSGQRHRIASFETAA